MTLADTLLSVVYVSSASHMLADEEILAILRTSRVNNERLGITGMLLYKEGNFMQVLEGPEEHVRQLTQVIRRDARHRGYQQLIAQQTTERQFDGWSMGFKNIQGASEDDKASMSSFLTDSLLDEKFRSEPAAAYRLLRRFKQSVR